MKLNALNCCLSSFFVYSAIYSTSIDSMCFVKDNIVEVSSVHVKLFDSLTLNIIGVYRPPFGNLILFNDEISGILNHVGMLSKIHV